MQTTYIKFQFWSENNTKSTYRTACKFCPKIKQLNSLLSKKKKKNKNTHNEADIHDRVLVTSIKNNQKNVKRQNLDAVQQVLLVLFSNQNWSFTSVIRIDI